MDPKLRNSAEAVQSQTTDPMMFGRMAQALETLTVEVKELKTEVRGQSQSYMEQCVKFERLENTLTEVVGKMEGKANSTDIDRLVDDKLGKCGLSEPDEIKRDLVYLRDARKRHDQFSDIMKHAVKILVTGLLIAAVGWIGAAGYNQFTDDIKTQSISK